MLSQQQLLQLAALREECIRVFKCDLAGWWLFGAASESKDGPLIRTTKVLDLPADAEAKLGKIAEWFIAKVKDILNPKKEAR